jgi:hypothetical protein
MRTIITVGVLALVLGCGFDGPSTIWPDGDDAEISSDESDDSEAAPEAVEVLDDVAADETDDRCAPGLTWCPGGDPPHCFDLLSNPLTCGSCDVRCVPQETCEGGHCVCVAPNLWCADSLTADPRCVDPMTDELDCGGCHDGGYGLGDRCSARLPCCIYGGCSVCP